MIILRTRASLIRWRRMQKARIGFVPTMGALHEGHMSLVNRAKRECEKVIVSIFVNPTQFGPKEDFSKYPKTELKDLNLLKKRNVDAVFIPASVFEVYSRPDETSLKARESLSRILCGRFRPGHFDGVLTVVYKFFSWVEPHRAYFGEKDFQQLKIIEAMVEDLNLPIKIVACPTKREPSGLAMSSRNQYLSVVEKRKASELYVCLSTSKSLFAARNRLRKLGFKVQYLEAWNLDLSRPLKSSGRWLAAVFFKGVRLIDNVDRTK